MVLFRVADSRHGWLYMFSLGLLLLAAAHVQIANGQQQAGVSLVLQGQTIPNNSLVNIEDLLRRTDDFQPTNANGEQTLMCVTDLKDCCESPHTVHGNWFYPDGRTVVITGGATFLSNRGANEVINNQQFLGSVRLWYRYTPLERGFFRCVLPDANSVDQTLYVYILFFNASNGAAVIISPSGSTTAGETYSLTCSATLTGNNRNPDPSNITPPPTFEWFFGPNGNDPLPSGLTAQATVVNSLTYTSTLEFPVLSQSHSGMYTCRLGAGRLVNNNMFTVNAPPISATITANLNTPLMVGQTGNTLTCGVTGAENLSPVIAYQWTRNDGSTHTQVGTKSSTLTLSPLRLSNGGEYTCSATVGSTLLNSDIPVSAGNSQRVMIQIPDPQSVSLTSDPVSPVINGYDVTLTCTVKMRQEILDSEIFLLMVDVHVSQPDGTPLTLTGPSVTGTTFTYTTQLNSFGRSDSGNYTCNTTVRPHPSSTYLTGISTMLEIARITTGVYFSIQSRKVSSYANNSDIVITDIGEGDCGALLCFTDLIECCHDRDTPAGEGALGQWLYPNGSVVGTRSDGQVFYIDRGAGVVRLNRRSNAISTTGLFCCEIPDANSANTKICINVIVPQSEKASMSTCTSEVAIGVVTTILIEVLLAVPIIAVVLVVSLKRRKSPEPDRSSTADHDRAGVQEDVYEEPDKLGTITTTGQPGKFELTECPAYVAQTELRPHTATEIQTVTMRCD